MHTIVRAAEADAPAILDLQRSAYESEARLYNDWSIPPLVQTLDSIRAELRTATVLKAVIEELIVGSVRATFDAVACKIGRLVVSPDLQGRGIGSALLSAVEAQFPTAKYFELFTGSLSTGNIRLYQKQGYAITHSQVLSATVTLVFMRKSARADA